MTESAIDAGARAGVEDTRMRILSAARDLYAHHGSRGTTTREVAVRAGVNEATVFRHFGTKQQLLQAMLDHFCSSSSVADTLPTLSGPIEKQLRELAFAAIEAIGRKADLIKISQAEEVSNPAGAIAWTVPMDSQLMMTAYMREKVESGVLRGEPAMLARLFMSMYFSYVMARRLWDAVGLQSTEEAVALTVDHFLNGAKAK